MQKNFVILNQATHVPDQTSTILSSRTLPRCDSGLPRNTQNCTSIMGDVFERPPAQEGLSSTIFNNSLRDWDLIPSIHQDKVMEWQENRGVHRFKHLTSKAEVECCPILVELILTIVWLIIREIFFGIESWKMSWLYWNFIDGKSTSELRFVYEQPILDELTSRSIVVRTDFPDFDMLDAMIKAALNKLLKTQSNFWNRVSVEEQRAQKHDRFLRGRQIAYMIYEHFRATGACEAVFTRTLISVRYELTEWRRPGFRRQMLSCLINCE